MPNSHSPKSALFDNAIMSIKVGVKDYQKNTLPRAIASVRNLHAGILLLAKEVLVRRAGGGPAEKIIHSNYKPVPDRENGVRYVPTSERTINLYQTVRRFRDFELAIDEKALQSFNKLRNRIEHHSSDRPRKNIQEAIAKALPIIQDLLRLAKEEPGLVLGKTWNTMLEVKEVYDKELNFCRKTFTGLRSSKKVLHEIEFICPDCGSSLLRQIHPENKDLSVLEGVCQSCQITSSAQEIVPATLAAHFAGDIYLSYTDGDINPVGHCSECGIEAMVLFEEKWQCLLCENVLKEECWRCGEPLTPITVANDSSTTCAWCVLKD